MKKTTRDVHVAALLTEEEDATLRAFLQEHSQSISEAALMGLAVALNDKNFRVKKRKKGLKTKQIQFRVTPYLYSEMKKKADTTGCTCSDIVFEGLRRMVKM